MTRLGSVLGVIAILCSGVGFDDVEPAPERDYGRTCLALVGFSEARDQSDAGLAAVMQVVVNRATDPSNRWPHTLCDVAMQPGQFLGVDNWPTPRNPQRIDADAWARALLMADSVIDGSAPTPDQCRGATGFDQDAPGRQSNVVCQVGAHTFYADPPPQIATK